MVCNTRSDLTLQMVLLLSKNKNQVIDYCSFWRALFGWKRWPRLLLLTFHSVLCSLALFLCSSHASLPPHIHSTHIDTLLIAQLWREILKNACFYCPLLKMLCESPVCHRDEMPSCTFFCLLFHCALAYLSTLCDLMCSLPPLYLWGKLLKTKGTQHRGVGFFWNTINVILYIVQRFIFFMLSFLTVYVFFFCGSWVLICMHVGVLSVFSILYVCVCYNGEYFHFTDNTAKGWTICERFYELSAYVCDSLYLLFFYLIC